jgi:phosphatidylglycerophosphate synthase
MNINEFIISIFSIFFIFDTTIFIKTEQYSFFFVLFVYLASVTEISFYSYIFKRWKRWKEKIKY